MNIHSTILETKSRLLEEKIPEDCSGALINRYIRHCKTQHYKIGNQLKISNELCINISNITAEEALTQNFAIDSNGFIAIVILCQGNARLSSQAFTDKLGQGNVYLVHRKQAHFNLHFSKGTHKLLSILLSRKFFLELSAPSNGKVENKLYQKINKGNPIPFGSFKVPLGFQFHRIINEIIENQWEPEGQIRFMRLKLKELFLQLHYQGLYGRNPFHYQYSESSIVKIKKAKAYLTVNYQNPPSIKKLSRIVLLNEFELKKGFKEIYGDTVRGYIIRLRMKKAASLLRTHQVKNTAELLGYKSVPHFIQTFKKFYDQTPKQFYRGQKAS